MTGAASWMVWTDFGGVLTPPVAETFDRFCAAIDVPPDRLRAALAVLGRDHGGDAMVPLEFGSCTEREWTRRLEEILAADGVLADLSDFTELWFDDRPVNEPWLRWLRELAAGGAAVDVGMLSNMPPAWDPYWRRMVVPQGLFRELVLSGELGLRKPDPRIFAVATRRSGLPAERNILVDDLEANCAGARAAGWRAVRFEDAASAIDAVGALLVGAGR